MLYTNESINSEEFQRALAILKETEEPVDDVVDNIMIPNFQEIDHESIMRFYVRECIEDKKIRKTLFCILRRHDYVTPFIDKL